MTLEEALSITKELKNGMEIHECLDLRLEEMFNGKDVTIDDFIIELNKIKERFGNIKCCPGEYATNSIYMTLMKKQPNGFLPDLPASELYLSICEGPWWESDGSCIGTE